MTPGTEELPGGVGEVARKLTEAQRRLLLGDTRYVRRATYDNLIKLGLLYQVGGFMCRTELGLALRAHLQANPATSDSKDAGR